ncbi:uncharacterized protein LOC141854467 [Brevipalpus obovatus]|uniref:uncharacterized protein LOC141854467 n=1 Tax=Brevipalpus obovatus TaxID=246614 RepID=UPI003D9F4B29
MPRLKSCFWIIPLRQACFIIGFYHIVLYSFFVIMSAHNVELMPMLREYDHLLSTLLSILLSAIDLVSAVLLIIGIGVENKNLLRPWMIAIPISIVYNTMYLIYSLMDEPDTDIDPTYVMLTTIECLLNVYFLFVVGSQFQIYRKNYEQRKNNFRSIAPKTDMDMIEQYDSRYPRHSDVSQDYSDGDQADNHSINPSHTSVVSTELFGVSNGKRNSSGSCECLSVNIK